MAGFYLVLALVLAATLNARSRWLRLGGTLLAAAGLFMMVYSIILADLDGTFARLPGDAPLIERLTPAILNAQAVLASLAIAFLLWSAWRQVRRPVAEAVPLANTPAAFGAVSRSLHWVMAVMMLSLVPIGLFMAILPDSAPERADFASAHQSLGLSIAALVIIRLVWLRLSPAPAPLTAPGSAPHRAARLVHGALYAALLAFPVSGVMIAQGAAADFYGLAVRLPQAPATAAELAVLAHAWVLPALFYAALAAHLSAVIKRHFAERDTHAVRRMLR